MRVATSGQEIFYDEAGNVFGLDLGCGWCAEHEEGISKLERLLGVPGPGGVLGIEAHQQTIVPDTSSLVFTSGTVPYERWNATVLRILPWAHLAVSPVVRFIGREVMQTPPARDFRIQEQLLATFSGELEPGVGFTRLGLQAYWDITGFSINAVGSQACALLGEFHQAILTCELVVGISAMRSPFDRPGLALMIASRVPKNIRDNVLASDEAYVRLQAAFKNSGIEKILQEAGCGYYELTPAWDGVVGEELKFYLRPYDPYPHSGWFSLQELKDWATMGGPFGGTA